MQMQKDVFAPSLGTHKLSGTLEGLRASSCGYNCRIVFSIERNPVDGAQDNLFHKARLEGMFKRLGWNVKVIEEAAIIQVFDRFTVSEEGVKGTGPISERIQKIFDKYKAQTE